MCSAAWIIDKNSPSPGSDVTATPRRAETCLELLQTMGRGQIPKRAAGQEEELLLHDPSALQSIRRPLFASPSASCHPEWERQETAATWDFQTFSESDAVGEGEESVPTPSQAETNSAALAQSRNLA